MRAPLSPRDAVFVFGPFLLLPARRILLREGEAVRIGRRAFDLLIALVVHAGKVVSKTELIGCAWPGLVAGEGTLRIHVAGLRRALGESGDCPRYVASIPARGYCFIAEVARCDPSAQRAVRGADAFSRVVEPRLIGREQTIAALAEALERCRLVSVVGPGGMGKTSVARAVAARVSARYAHGAHFVDLSVVSDPVMVTPTVAAALNMPTACDADAAGVTGWLATRSALLVLDNCEHVMSAVAALVDALAKTAGVHVLATSRQPLGLAGEWIERLPALQAPPPGCSLGHAEAMAFPAFELFVDRATASCDGVNFSDHDVPDIAALCRRLDGIPLAIELAAAQIGFYGLKGLRALLYESASLSAMSRRTAQPRQRTLRAMLEWSFRLLSPQEREVLCQLSVFCGHFTLRAAVQVGAQRACDMADVLQGLVEKSLVNMDADMAGDEPHYRLLETTRSFAAEQLKASELCDAVASRHAAHCIEAVRATALQARDLAGPWRARHAHTLEDVRSALRWALEGDHDVTLGCELAVEAAALFAGLGFVREHLKWLQRGLDRLPQAPDHAPDHAHLRMLLLLEHGHAGSALQDDPQAAMASLTEGARLAVDLGERCAELDALQGLFDACVLQARHEDALTMARRFEAAAHASADAPARLVAHRLLAVAMHLGGRELDATRHVRDAMRPGALGVGRLHGHPCQLDHRTAMFTLQSRMLWLQGQPEQAERMAQQALEAARAAGHPHSQAHALALGACPVALWNGDGESACRRVDELERIALQNDLPAWQMWPAWYRLAMARMALSCEVASPAQPPQPVQADVLATLHGDFIDTLLLERVELSEGHWCAPELLRQAAVRLSRRGRESDAEKAEGLLRTAMAQADVQGATAWTLRCAIDLASLVMAPKHRQARSLLDGVLARYEEGEGTRDLRLAVAALQRIDAAGGGVPHEAR